MASYDLASLDDVKDYLGMTGSDTIVDDLLEDLVTRVTVAFHKYCGIEQFIAKDYTEYQSGSGTPDLFPKNIPVNSVSLLASDYDWTFGADSTYTATDFAILDDRIVLKDEVFPEGLRNIKVIYNAGYTSAPEDLKQVCIMEVARLYKLKDNIDVSQKSGPDGSVTKLQQGFLPDTINILKRYSSVGVY